ncbi:MAG: cation diffusion facilitator family transporter [Candidatus Levyibacteriota bacterium]
MATFLSVHHHHRKEDQVTSKRVLITSFLVDILDILVSLVIAVISGSVIMLTEVFEGIADLASSGFLLVGYYNSRQKEDSLHPFGYGREMYFWALLSALVMFGVTATLSIYFGWKRIFQPQEVHSIYVVFTILLITLFTNSYACFLSLRKLLQGRSLRYIINMFYRPTLIEVKTTFILDFMGATASFVGFISLFMYKITGDMRFDGFGALSIGISLAICSYFLIIGIHDLLIGRGASYETREKIKKAAMRIEEVEDVLGMKTLHMGSEKLLVNLDVRMDASLTTRELEKLIDKIKYEIRTEVPNVKYLQVELETPKKPGKNF